MTSRPTTVLLVRHAEVHNPRDIFYGRLPRFRLSELGLRQAAFVAGQLARTPIATFYVSPLLRTRQTAAILARPHRGATLHCAKPLIEVATSWTGAPNARLPKQLNLYEPRKSAEDETIEDIWERLSGFVAKLVRRHAGGTICCVSHGDPIAIARAGFAFRPLSVESIRGGIYPQRCSLTWLRFREGVERPELEVRDLIGELAPELVSPA